MVDGRIPIKQIGGGTSYSTDWKMANVSLPSKLIEYEYALQDGVRQIIISSRTPAIVKIATVLGETSTNYKTLWRGCSMEIADVKFTGKKLYFKSDKDSTVMEIVELF